MVPKVGAFGGLAGGPRPPRFPHGKMPTVILITVGQVSYSEVSLEKEPEPKTHGPRGLVNERQLVALVEPIGRICVKAIQDWLKQRAR